MQAAAVHSFGSKLFVAPFLVGDPDTFTELGIPTLELGEDDVAFGAVKTLALNGRSFSKVQVRQMRSTDFTSEYIPGFEEGGQFDVTLHYSEVLMTTLLSYLPSVNRGFPDHGRKRWRIVDPGGSYFSICGYMDPPGVSYQDDQPVEIQLTIHAGLGRPTFTQV